MLLTGKNILVGVSGGIAIYKVLDVISGLKKLGADVKVIMTQAATEFVTPLTFQTMSQNMVALNMFEEPKSWEVRHISLAKWADLFLFAPATANGIGKLANGIADDMLSTVAMASKAPKLIAPAMNSAMYENPILIRNINILKELGVQFVEPYEGVLACGDLGKGKLAQVEEIIDAVVREVAFPRDLTGWKILVTAGPTQEKIDPVRFITNHSTGKMGFEIARAAKYRGAKVTLVAGKTHLTPPRGVEFVPVVSAEDMYEAVTERAKEQDVIIKSAAVGDYKPAQTAEHKIKKNEDMSIRLTKNKDILAQLGQDKEKEQILVGFCMETENLIENAKGKLVNKNLDMIVANHLLDENAGFGSDSNTVTIIDKKQQVENLPNMSKLRVANEILDRVIMLKKGDA